MQIHDPCSSFLNRDSDLNLALALGNFVLIILISLSFPLSSFYFFPLMKKRYAKRDFSSGISQATQRDSNQHVEQVPHTIFHHTLSTETGLSSLLSWVTLKGSTLQQKHLQNFSTFQIKSIQETLIATGQTQELLTSIVNKNTFNEVFKFFKFHKRKYKYLNFTKSCMKSAGEEYLKPITIYDMSQYDPFFSKTFLIVFY